jgi:sugar/nucleoside kinase (ribokinase family)
MKLGIASHIVIDSIIDSEGTEIESLGGPACYASVMAKTFKVDVALFTKVGKDIYDKEKFLKENDILIKDEQIDEKNPTTRFQLLLDKDGGRKLFLLSKCSPISISYQDASNLDGLILSPVMDEIPNDIFRHFDKAKKDKFVMLDPQGFLRFCSDETLSISNKKQLDLDIKGITAIKTDEEELSALTKGITCVEGMRLLQKKYCLEFVISTGNNKVLFLNKNTLYTLSFGQISSPDSTGLGDILTSGFTCSYLKEKDPLWAFCFGAGAVVASLNSKKRGLEKVPRKMNLIERDASYFYNTTKFKILD